ncbi:MAG: choice-of-anchor D domain-containing protein, partial [Vicinamibacterales bacterium]
MYRLFKYYYSTLTVIALAFCGILLANGFGRVRASVPTVPVNEWAPTGVLDTARAGAAATLLFDGRVLVTGGMGSGGALLASAERYSPDGGGFLETPPMGTPRANHTATLLPDGRVLVTGGVGEDGQAVSSAELYDPQANAWTAAAPMNVARAGHTATALYEGQVVLVGGNDGAAAIDSIEVYDPLSGTFTLSTASLGGARTGHAAALLYDDTIFISGGFDGTAPTASSLLFNFWTDSIAPGPALQDARAGHSATTLLDGKVLLAGGAGVEGELVTAEVYDPITATVAATENVMAAARQRHQAILLPHNSQVLIVGGTAGASGDGDAIATAELYVPWQGAGGSFVPTDAPAAGRAWSAAAPLSFNPAWTVRTGPNDGLLLLAGGSAKSDATNALASAELYGFATVLTDLADYHPGMTVTIGGGGWVPGESVSLTLVESQTGDVHTLQPVIADGGGHILSTEFVPDEGDIGIRFFLTAVGGESQAQTSFTDAAADTITVSPTTLVGNSTSNTLTFTFLSGTDYSGKGGGGQVSVAVPSGVGWTAPTAGNISVDKGGCDASFNSIVATWTILIDQSCKDKAGKGGTDNTFSFTWSGVTAAPAGTSAANRTFTSQSGKSGSLTDVGGTQPIITLTAGALDHFAISTISSPQTAGTAITGITITAQDASNNTVTSFTGTVTYSGTAGITGTSAAFTAGVLTGVSVTPTSAGSSRTFIVTGGSSKTGTATFNVNAGALDHFAISSISSPRTLNVPITGITLTAQDANNNTVTSFTSTVTYSGTAGITGTSASFTAGVLSGVSVTPTVAGTSRTFTVTGGASKTGTATFDVVIATLYAAGSFTWDTGTTAAWSTTSGGPYTTTWIAGSNAVLEGTAGTVSIAAAGVAANSVTFTTTGYTVQNNTLTLNGDATVSNDTGIDATISSVIAGSAGLTKTGDGTLTLSGANTFTGTAALNGGVVQIGAANNLGGSSAISFTGGRLYATASGITLSQPVTSNTPGGAEVRIDSGTITFSGGWSGAGALRKYNAGTMVLNGAYTASGKPTVNAGTLQLGSSGSISTTNMDVSSGGTFDFNGKNASFTGTVSIAGAGAGSAGALVNSASSTTSTLNGGAAIVLTADAAVGGGGHVVLPGIISGSSIGLVKVGTGTLTLQGVNTYSGGTTIAAGTLALNSSGSIANTAFVDVAGDASFDVAAGGGKSLGASQTLRASGSTTGGTLATAASNGLTLASASPISFTNFRPTGSGGAVPLTLSGAGTLTLGSASPVTVTVSNSGTPLAVGSYKLIGKGASGTVAQLPGGALTVNGDGVNGVASLALTGGELFLVVSAGSATHLSFGTQPSNAAAGTAISPAVTVRVLDSFNNVVTTDNSTQIALAIGTNPGSGTLTGGGSLTVVNGVATFGSLSINKPGTGYTLAASSTPSLTGDTSTTFNVTPGTATHLAFGQQPTTTDVGDTITPPVTVRVLDALDNVVTTDDSTKITLAIGTNPGGGTLTGGAETTVVAGVATFAALSINNGATGYTLAASDTTGGGGIHPLTGATSDAFDISGGNYVAFSPTTLSFGPRLPDVTGIKTVQLTYSGPGSLTITDIAAAGDGFGLVSEDCPPALTTAGSCTIALSFTPGASFLFGTSYSGTLTVTDSAPGSPHVLNLEGHRTYFQPFSFDVGFVPVGTTSTTKTFRSYNIGTDTVTTGPAAVSIAPAQFTVVGETCSSRTITPYNAGDPANPSAYCTIDVQYSPTASGHVEASIGITDTDTRTHELRVKATGYREVKASPATGVSFGNVPAVTPSAVRTVTLSNASGSEIALTSIDVAGAGFARTGGTCGVSIAAGSTCTVDLQLTPAAGPAAGSLSVTNDGDVSPVVVPLSGTGSFSMKVTSAVSLGKSPRGIPSVVKTLTLTNTNGVAIPLTSLQVTAGASDFAVTGGSCAAEVPANGACTTELTMTPSEAGARTGTLTIASDAVGSPQDVALSGTGQFDLKVSAAGLAFGSAGVGIPIVKIVTLTNVNGVPIDITAGVTVGADDFSRTGGSCGAQVPAKVGPANGTCTIELTFSATETGARAGTLAIASNAENGPHAVALSGTGTQSMSVSASGLGFSTTPVGIASSVKTLTLRNPNGVPVAINSIEVTDGMGEFARTGGTCADSVPAKVGPALGTCTVDITMTPAAPGARTGTLTVDVDAAGSPFAVSLSGTATFALKVSAASINFGTVAVGATGGVKTVTLTNVNGVPISLTPIPLGAIDASGFERTGGSCGSAVPAKAGPANGTCTIEMRLIPATGGPQAATLSIASDASGSPQTVLLSGNASVPL